MLLLIIGWLFVGCCLLSVSCWLFVVDNLSLCIVCCLLSDCLVCRVLFVASCIFVLFDVRRSLCVFGCVLFVVRCLWFVMCCLLCVVCCLYVDVLFVVCFCCLLAVVRCLLCVVRCMMLYDSRLMFGD